MDKIFDLIKHLLIGLGLEQTSAERFDQGIKLIIITLIVMAAAGILKLIFVFIKRELLSRFNFGENGRKHIEMIILRIIGIIVLILTFQLLPLALVKGKLLTLLLKVCIIIIIIFCINIINILLNTAYELANRKDKYRQRPLKGFMQILQIGVYFIGLIVIVATIINKSPIGLLTGLGAFAAVLSFIFKDTITGFIAGIQLSYNDMVKVGDWITVNGTMANGVVIDISLITVKIQNFDNTIVNVPTYSLMTTPFQNWRGMEESAGRRITLTFNIDTESVKFCTEEELAQYGKYIQIPHNTQEHKHITNLELYRMFLLKQLLANPHINTSLTIMVRYLQSGPDGIPLQLYCFSKDKNWVIYEGIQAAILEQAVASANLFDISIFQMAFKTGV
ncbi:MAG: mechanosensitive ion channel [Bacteroidales bacterium]|nr:mechanosensitive ion channel [Bacteroidales bacterium]